MPLRIQLYVCYRNEKADIRSHKQSDQVTTTL